METSIVQTIKQNVIWHGEKSIVARLHSQETFNILLIFYFSLLFVCILRVFCLSPLAFIANLSLSSYQLKHSRRTDKCSVIWWKASSTEYYSISRDREILYMQSILHLLAVNIAMHSFFCYCCHYYHCRSCCWLNFQHQMYDLVSFWHKRNRDRRILQGCKLWVVNVIHIIFIYELCVHLVFWGTHLYVLWYPTFWRGQ